MWGDVGRCGEIWGDTTCSGSASRTPPAKQRLRIAALLSSASTRSHQAAVYQRLLASHALLPPPAGALPPQQHEALLRQRASHVKVELEDVSRTCRGRVPGEEAAEPMAAGCGGADFAGGAPPRALACGYCSLAPLGSLLEGRGWAVEMASGEHETWGDVGRYGEMASGEHEPPPPMCVG